MTSINANDLNVYYIEAGEGTPIVFVHGNWTTSLSWEPVLERLPGGYRGVAYDVRGRGETTGLDNDYTMPELAADLLAFADALRLDGFHLVGHSLGSGIAMQFALEHPERLRSLVVVSPAWVDGMPAAYNVPAAQQMLHDDREVLAQALKAQMPSLTDEAFFQQLVDGGYKQRVEASMRNLPALLDWQPGDSLRVIPVPSLVISGALDLFTGGANADRAAEALGTVHVTMQDVGHSPNIEAPGEFVALLIEYISRAGVQSSPGTA